MTEEQKPPPVVHLGKGRLGEAVEFPEIRVEYPGWVRRHVDWTRLYPGERDRMRVALQVARQNVDSKTGGPFGAAVFESLSGRLVSVGLDLGTACSSALLHAETVALLMAERRLGALLEDRNLPPLEIHATCEPCPMCAGAIELSCIPRLTCAATRTDAEAAGFGFAESALDGLEERGVRVRRELLRAEAREILQAYRAMRRPPAR